MTARRQPIAKSWERFERMVLPANASNVQRQEMRKAFFGGASVLFTILTRGMSEGSEPQEQDMDLMNDAAAEIDEYGESLDADIFKRMGGIGRA